MYRLLIVDDDELIRQDISAFMDETQWIVEEAACGAEALKKLKNMRFDVMILDYRMPDLNGMELLARLKEKNIAIPPTIVLSAYLEKESVNTFMECGAQCIVSKPMSHFKLEEIALSIVKGKSVDNNVSKNFISVPSVDGNQVLVDSDIQSDIRCKENIEKAVAKRETGLLECFRTAASVSFPVHADDPLFVVGRRWNSWYPSFFNVPGGAYAIVCPFDKNKRRPSVIIDPGFRCLEVMRNKIKLSLADLSTCIISHNHPDHLGGIFEYMAARYTYGEPTTLICNEATAVMLGDCSGFLMSVKKLKGMEQDALRYEDTEGLVNRLSVSSFDTSHEEIGRDNSTQALIMAFHKQKDLADPYEDCDCKVVILGDTSYSRHDHRDKWLSKIVNFTTTVLVLHIGSAQLKWKTDKHLYFSGLSTFLDDLDAELVTKQYSGKLLVLISEWGLEHATNSQILRLWETIPSGFDETSPIIDTTALLGTNRKKIHLLPADIGLIINIKSKNIILPTGIKKPEEVIYKPGDEGIDYS